MKMVNEEFLTREEKMYKLKEEKEKKHRRLKDILGIRSGLFTLKRNERVIVTKEKLMKKIHKSGITSSLEEAEKYIEEINGGRDLFYKGFLYSHISHCEEDSLNDSYRNGSFLRIQKVSNPKEVRYNIQNMYLQAP